MLVLYGAVWLHRGQNPLQDSHDLIQFECIIAVNIRLHVDGVVVEVEDGGLSLREKRNIIKLLSLGAQLNYLEVESLDTFAVIFLSKLRFKFHHGVEGSEQTVTAKEVKVLLYELAEHDETLRELLWTEQMLQNSI